MTFAGAVANRDDAQADAFNYIEALSTRSAVILRLQGHHPSR